MSKNNFELPPTRHGCRRASLVGLVVLTGLAIPLIRWNLWWKHELEGIERLAAEARRLGGGGADVSGGVGLDFPRNHVGVILDLARADVGDNEFARLASMKAFLNLVAFDLSDTRITDKSLKLLGKASNLDLLNLSRTRITDKGLESIARLPNLGSLYLAGTAVTDRGIDILVKTRGAIPLGNVDLTDTKVSAEGVRKLSKAFRSVVIEHPAAVHPAANKQ